VQDLESILWFYSIPYLKVEDFLIEENRKLLESAFLQTGETSFPNGPIGTY